MKDESHIDAEIIQNFLNGDKDAITSLVKRWHLKFCNKAYWILKDSELAKDVAQDSWRVILEKLDALNNTHSFKNWAYKIVCSKSFDALRKRNKRKGKRELLDTNRSDSNIETRSDNEVIINKLLTQIQNLPVSQQLVIRLFYLEEQSIKAISKQLNISTGTVKSRLFHAREKLKTTLKHISYEN